MRSFIFIVVSSLLVTYAFGSVVTDFITSYASQSIDAQRVVVEESQSPKIRYERVLRCGKNEVIDVIAPDPFEWALLDGKSYIINNDEMKLSPATIVDIEQRFVQILSATSTVISSTSVVYQGESSYEITALTRNATYIAVIGKQPMLLKYLKVKRSDGTISMIYTSISIVPPDYFNNFIKGLKIDSATPETMERVAWKIISNIKNASIASMDINGVTLTIIAGMFLPQENFISYLFNSNSNISPQFLVNQFKSQGYNSLSIKYENVYVVFATKVKIDDLRVWIKKVFNDQ